MFLNNLLYCLPRGKKHDACNCCRNHAAALLSSFLFFYSMQTLSFGLLYFDGVNIIKNTKKLHLLKYFIWVRRIDRKQVKRGEEAGVFRGRSKFR